MDGSMSVAKSMTPAIGDLQGQQNMAISECIEVAHALRARLEPIRTPPQPETSGSVPTEAPALPTQSPIAVEVISQTERINDITRILRAALSEIEL